MDSTNFKKFAAGAGMFFNRAKQYTEEKLGHAEKTELDAHFENLLQRADKTKQYTERIMQQTEAVIQPNPSHRVENMLYSTFDKRRPDRQTNTELLGQYMIETGNEFGPGTAYGSSLVKCGHTEQKLGNAERDFMQSTANNFLQPLKAFLDGDMKTVGKERKLLENKRLDLDAAKNKLRRAKSQNSKDQAEAELRVAQAEFDRQAEITKLLLEGISSTHAHHLRCLNDFVEAQLTYHAQCQQYLSDLQRQLGSVEPAEETQAQAHFSVSTTNSATGGGCTSPTIHPPVFSSMSGSKDSKPTAPPASESNSTTVLPGDSQKARVLYDYDAADMTELSLLADEEEIHFP